MLPTLAQPPYYRDTMADTITEIFHGLSMHFGDIRRIGSAALSICSIACGEADAFCEPFLSPWDFSAGMLILTEAGGIATDFNGDPLHIGKPSSVLAATPSSFETVLPLVKRKI